MTMRANRLKDQIKIKAGESEFAEHNFDIGKIEIEDMLPVSRKKAAIEMTFELDQTGNLTVKTKENTFLTGKEFSFKTYSLRIFL